MKRSFLSNFILFIIATLPFTIERKLGGVWITSSDALVVCALALWGCKMIRERSLQRMRFPGLLITGSFLLALGSSVPGAVSQYAALKELAKYFLTFGFFYLLVNEVSDEQTVHRIPAAVFLASVALSVWFLHDFFFRGLPYYYLKAWERPPFSTLHFNMIGSYQSLAIPFGFHILLHNPRPSFKFLASLGLLVDIAALVFSYSRINWFVTVLIILLIFAMKYRMKGIVIAMLLLVIPTTLLVKTCPQYKIQERLAATFLAQEGSRTERGKYAAAALRLVGLRPVFGVGIGNYQIASNKYLGEDVDEMTHNVYLQLWAESGPAAMLLFVTLIIMYYRAVRRIALVRPAPGLYSLQMFGMFAFTAMILSNQFGDPFVRIMKEHFALLLAMPFIIEGIVKASDLNSACARQS